MFNFNIIEINEFDLVKVSMATNDKYDRQLRLWGANGQRALMNSRYFRLYISVFVHFNLNDFIINSVLVIIATRTGSGLASEVLKNLVLPGVGHFTIWDPFEVTEADLR